ncbi:MULTISPECIES: MarR family transcriptional regulator [unclassified Actinomyces]|uniref:MarR family winged helix-turn-helix transcriptional regulator n=1 Tax=unclassified Actinomyces TaxID=2609248 RepID=UPI002017AABF|nr:MULTISPECIES: MarR family transcriptional regulator [unclassified Actinomyces]MCL3776779.1 MarR family transcriptional regulator [Actinomyces sp. AC-20-1]MCL3789873.1 MarR family transcriptional regulator [Actinomyces sp. 187325]MCL3794772.1 MarR family transcriptional regulator [Actinomyces sp. 217892]
MQHTQLLGFMINHVARQLERHMAEALRPLGLRPAYLPVLLILAESQPRTQAELATVLDIRQPTMAQTLSRMERDGLITRTPSAHDRRSASIHLTDKARGLTHEVVDIGRRISAEATRSLTPERRARLLEDLGTIAADLAS